MLNELKGQYQVSLRFKQQENRLKIKQSQLELEQLAESHKMQLIEMELKIFELENNSSEVGEKVEESNSTGGSLPISKVTTDRTNDLVDSVSSRAPPDGSSALGLLAFIPVPDSSVPTMSSNITIDSFANGQPESLPVPMLPAQPGTGFVSLSPGVCFWFCLFVTWCLLVVASHLLELPNRWFSFRPLIAMHRHMTQHNIPFVPHIVSPNINDYYTSDANLWRLATTTPIVTPAQCCKAANMFSNVTTVVTPGNTATPYTSGGTVYLNTPPVLSQHVPHFVNYTNIGYQPVNSDYAPSSPYPNQGCSSDRPLSAREFAKSLMHSRNDHLPEWKLARFDGNP